ncbi:MAG: ABC transporter permease subunit [Candidatus Sericytochromatia bacterium]|nr:ABC transporter permease subunit [Candidatus Sericytochromatia bacterium]
MSPIFAIIERELKAYFVSPIAYVVIAMFLALSGYFFAAILFLTKDASMTYQLSNMAVILLLLSPMISMRLLAEEQRQGTLELLCTSPITDAGIVIGKYVAALGLLAVMLLFTGYGPAILFMYAKPELQPILSGYLGLFLVGAAFLAIGVMASAWTKNQIVAAAISFAICLILWILGASSSMAAGGSWGSELINYLALEPHFGSFVKGVFDTSDIIYYFSLSAVAIFIAIRSLESRRWR